MDDNKQRALLRRLDAAVSQTERLLAELTAIKHSLAGEHPVKDVLTHFDETWRKTYNAVEPYRFTDGDAGNVKRLLGTMDVRTVKARITRYLNDGDQWLVRQKHPLSLFVSRINNYSATMNFSETSPGSPPSDCEHTPRCATDARCTAKRRTELRA